MNVILGFKAEIIDNHVKDFISHKSTIITDDSTSYVNLENFVEEHKSQVIPKTKVGEILPWVHIAIGNARDMLLAIHHIIKPEYCKVILTSFVINLIEDILEKLSLIDYYWRVRRQKNEFRYRVR